MKNLCVIALALGGCFSETMPAGGGEESSGSEAASGSEGESGGSVSSTTSGASSGAESSGALMESEGGGSSGESDSSSSSEESSGESSGSTGGPALPPYSPCTPDDLSLCNEGDICIYGEDVLLGNQVGWCSSSCNIPEECPEGTDGDAQKICTYYGPDLQCSLSCSNGETCPEGMYCAAMLHFPRINGDYVSVCANMR